jgi:hypothetical protein
MATRQTMNIVLRHRHLHPASVMRAPSPQSALVLYPMRLFHRLLLLRVHPVIAANALVRLPLQRASKRLAEALLTARNPKP